MDIKAESYLNTQPAKLLTGSVYNIQNLVCPEGVKSVQAQNKPQSYVEIERIPIQKYYIDYEPVITFSNVPYQRDYEEQHTTSMGVTVPVTKSITDYQTIQTTSYKQIQVPYIDYKEIEHKVDYMPKIRYNFITQHIPQQQTEQIVEQHPYLKEKETENGIITDLENVQVVKNVTKDEIITQQIVQQIVEYEEIRTQKLLAESTVQCPQVEQPQAQQCVVQQSIHELQLNKPDNLPEQKTPKIMKNPSYIGQMQSVQNVPLVSSFVPKQNHTQNSSIQLVNKQEASKSFIRPSIQQISQFNPVNIRSPINSKQQPTNQAPIYIKRF